MTENHRSIRLFAGIAIASLLVSGGVFYSGYRTGTAHSGSVVVTGVNNATASEAPADFKIFWEVWSKLKNEHLNGGEANNQDLIYGAVSGLTNALGDPHTIFLKPVISQKFEQDLRGVFGGIGAEIGIKKDQLVVVAPLKDSPAEKAGIKAGDRILKIGETFTDGITIDDAVTKIRGPVGTPALLAIFREAWEKPKDFSITREIIRIPTLKWNNRDDGLVHIQLYNFNENAPQEFFREASASLLNPPKGIILDMRNNPGGFLDVAVNLAGWFLDKNSLVASEEFRSKERREFRTNGNAAFAKVPLVILVNEGSASASEILAGALRDLRAIPLIGKKTFGKGSVQDLQTLSDGSKLKLTIAHWLTPKDGLIDKVGIPVDFEVEVTEENSKDGKDPQLAKALEVLKAKIK